MKKTISFAIVSLILFLQLEFSVSFSKEKENMLLLSKIKTRVEVVGHSVLLIH